ncbi:DNA polymerase II large subunit [Candidatus Pacearchaeota archaeon]|nr:DNA polymerase II large subunit [Candidatus Pacearchaeota archaeon]
MQTEKYFHHIEQEIKKNYAIANEARSKGFDPVNKVEIPLARNLAEKSVGLISTLYPQINDPRIVNRIIELEKEYGSLDVAVCLKIAEEIAKEKFCKFSSHLEAIEAGIRVGFAYTTLGVVSSPIEGFTYLKLNKTRKGEDYFVAYFSGPIRSAGTTASCVVLMIIDYLREVFGYAKYDPSEKEIKRTSTELYDFHERITNLQYLPTEKEAEFLAANLPIQIAGEPSEKLEVSNYKDLPRIDTNFLRSGFCLILGEGLAQKAAKALRILRGLREKGFKLSDWDFLEKYVELHKKRESGTKDTTPTYMKDLVAGRPIFGHPSRSGAFRFRYGRSRVAGFSAVSIHPATMAISDGFLAVGTQLKIEKPTKGCVVSVCDSIDGPIVKLKNGSVEKVNDFQRAKEIYKDVEEIIYFGDILFPFGDVANRNSVLIKPGYVEEWWELELDKIGKKVDDKFNVDFNEAITFSKEYRIPLHPSYIYYWTQISYEQLLELLRWLSYARLNRKIILPYSTMEKEKFKESKRALELLGIEHDIGIENVIINGISSKALFANLGLNLEFLNEEEKFIENEFNGLAEKIINQTEREVLNIINLFSEFIIKDKAGEFIGARMGRPEKAKLRKLTGSPHVLFPVGEEGGRFRSVNEAVELGYVNAEFPIYFCEKCNQETIFSVCENCNSEAKKKFYCPICNEIISSEKCEKHERGQRFYRRRVDVKKYLANAARLINIENGQIPVLIKGVKGTSSQNHLMEHLSKGILRAGLGLNVNKDGTIRYDMTELPITHFKSKEIGTNIEKLKEIGYTRDIYGKELLDDDQILELMPHDIILPCSADSGDERADEVFLNLAKFIDLLLEKFYKLPRFYNAKTREDLVGHLSVCMAPHNCAGVISRIIGFSKTQGLLASPYMHAAMRRDCVYPKTKLFFYNSNNNKIFYNNIGNYVESLIEKGNKAKKIDSFGTLRVENKENLYTLGIDPDTHELKKKKIKYFIKGPLTKQWIKIKTATNREYMMTPTHKFLYIDNNEFKVKEAKEIKIGDKLPVLEDFNFYLDKKKLNLINIFQDVLSEDEKKNIWVIDGEKELKLNEFNNKSLNELKLRYKFSKHIIPASINIDKNLMRFLGYYAAEGYSRKNKWVSQVGFRICNREIQKDIIQIVKELFGMEVNLAEDNTKITVCSKLVYYLVQSLGAGKGAYSKRVPSFIFGVDKERARDYLSAYLDGDGSVVKGKNLVFYSVSRDLLDDTALLLGKFKVIGRYFKTKKRMPGKKVLDRYKELGKKPKEHSLNHLVLGVYDSYKLSKYLDLRCKEKSYKISNFKECENRYVKYNGMQVAMNSQSDYVEDYIKEVEVIDSEEHSYCLEVEGDDLRDKNVLWGEQILNLRCDGDEAAAMLLLDVLINFSREYLPGHRGGTQDAPLVLNGRIAAGEVDDQILDFEVVNKYPLELYEMAEKKEHSSKIKIEMVRNRIKNGEDTFKNINFTHDTSDFNRGVLCSSYKQLPTMQEKVAKEMELVNKIRAVDAADVARLIIERHFIRDIRGNLRKFSQQGFRCVKCNSKFRRPPLSGVCSKCNGKIIFTISEGGIIKYLEPALKLANDYDIPVYVKQNLELTKKYIESIFGREETKQVDLRKWF